MITHHPSIQLSLSAYLSRLVDLITPQPISPHSPPPSSSLHITSPHHRSLRCLRAPPGSNTALASSVPIRGPIRTYQPHDRRPAGGGVRNRTMFYAPPQTTAPPYHGDNPTGTLEYDISILCGAVRCEVDNDGSAIKNTGWVWWCETEEDNCGGLDKVVVHGVGCGMCCMCVRWGMS
ncbi:hypothetical protein EX30DRAFT_338097 [Ascodesmis nigricans]|uniref:Uncharacterized protein n=1 Tax=Ascodesmis nigricans TaxID=341454 RepID=A0A4V3SJC2_9PEZI|nr:hypothetical protein EX30DRAFT_338097 [Ascodesmis nigricans]